MTDQAATPIGPPDRRYLHAALAARRPDGSQGPEYADDLLRQALIGEAPHPDGVCRGWEDGDALLALLREHLPTFERAVAGEHVDLASERVLPNDAVQPTGEPRTRSLRSHLLSSPAAARGR